jgi:Zn-finger nucleic acid-binding protein
MENLKDFLYQQLSSKSKNNFYTKRYINFMISRNDKPKNVYTELHHILPKAKTQFPEYKNLVKYPWNGIELTGQEHFIAHWLLWKSQGGFMAYAFIGMRRCNDYQTDRYFKINGKSYEKLKEDASAAQSNRIILESTRQKISISNKSRPKGVCPHCNIEMDISNLKKYHLDNCKVFTGKLVHDIKQNLEIGNCPHCGLEGKMQGLLATHFDHCPKINNSRKITKFFDCPHCNKTLPDTQNVRNLHFDNCTVFTGIKREPSDKFKAANSKRGKPGVPKPKIQCPHCNHIGTPKRMLQNHFDNCIAKTDSNLDNFM